MATLADFRSEHPQYDDMPDAALADALHAKFYSDVPKADFFKTIKLGAGANIPGGEDVITGTKKPELSLSDKILGALETPVALASAVGTSVVKPIAGIVGTLTSGKYGTQAGIQAGEQTAKDIGNALTYQPRTQTAKDVLSSIGSFLEPVASALPPTLATQGMTLNALTGPAIRQGITLAQPAINAAVAPVKSTVINALARKEKVMPGMGAAPTNEQLLREQRLAEFGIPATAGERTKNLAQQQFESDVQRGAVAGLSDENKAALAEKMRIFKTNQTRDIVANFERMTSETGAEVADPTQLRQVGKIVDKALNDQYTKKFNEYKALYEKADTAGETLQPVSYQRLMDYINTKTPTMRQKLDPILDSVSESLALNDPNKTGTITVRDLENIYQQIGKTTNSPNAGELKKLITDMGEGAGGELYQAARASRRQLAKQFEDVSRVDKLLGTKAGYDDRRIALDDVFRHVVLDGSLEEMRTVTSLLKKTPEGQQAYKELQGQTIQQMKDMLTKGDQLSFKNLNTMVTQLDSEDKLAYMFGKAGRDKVLGLRDAIKDVVVKEPGAVNYPNTAGAVLRGLETLSTVKFPGAKTMAQIARNTEIKGKVAKALEQPNRLAPQENKNQLSK